MQRAAFEVITTAEQWQACLGQLRQHATLAIDLEANSMFAYREQVCLIQVSIPEQDYILDPLADFDLDELGRIIADPAREKIFHAAEYDLILMQREYGWELNGLFDTMWAARILGYDRFGLASLLEQFYDIKLDKRFQKSDWCRRPLSPEQLRYASFDTHYLFQLRDRLASELVAAGRWQEAQEIFAAQTQIDIPQNGFDPDDFWSINGTQKLSRQEQAVLKALNIYRDQEARRRNLPLFKVFSNRTLLDLASQKPSNNHELALVHGMSQGQVRRYGAKLLQVIEQGLQDKPPAYPKRQKRQPDIVVARYDRLHSWRKERARARGVESDVIISRDALWEIARSNPQSVEELSQLENLGDWRTDTYGAEIVALLQRVNAGQ
jgi:ribonuclease D